MADDKEEDIAELRSAERGIIEKERKEQEEEARNIRRKEPIRQPSREEYD